ncbi:MAG: dihydrofolate synthase/folylpolyglutamate synthase [Gammaproteobacteria bacterium]
MRFATLEEWLAWQESLHPSGMALGLERCREVLDQLGWGPLPFPVITVAGTNGKGSTIAFLEAMFIAGGYRVGSYTSPHLLRYNERIRVCGHEVSDDTVMAGFARIDDARSLTMLTYFEFATLAAVDIFQHECVDVALMEVGLGGDLDAVNLFDPDVAVVTSVDIDHTRWLGTDREAIARHKAGIFRNGRPAVISDPTPPRALAQVGGEVGAKVMALGEDFTIQCQARHWEWHGPGRSVMALPYPRMFGAFQTANAAGAIMAAHCLSHRFDAQVGQPLALSDDAIVVAMDTAQLRGRFEQIAGEPAWVLDVAHNPHAARGLSRSLVLSPCYGKTHAVVAMLDDKDHLGTLEPMMPNVDHWYVAGLAGLRGLEAPALARILRTVVAQPCINEFATVEAAVKSALANADADDRIVVFGSFHTVREALPQTMRTAI